MRDGRAASRAVARAEATFAKVIPENEAEWARFIDAAYLFGEAGHCFRDIADSLQIKRFAGESVAEARRQRRGRRGALSNAVLAIGDLLDGDAERATARSVHVVALAATVSSTRCRDVVRDLVHRLTPYRKTAGVEDFTEQAQAFLANAA